MNKSFITGAIIFLLVGFGCQKADNDSTNVSTINRDEVLFEAQQAGIIMSEEEVSQFQTLVNIPVNYADLSDVSLLNQDFKKWKSAALADVTGGESYGVAYTRFEKGLFELIVQTGNMTVPTKDYHYNVWLVKRAKAQQTPELVALGGLVPQEGGYVAIKKVMQDLSLYSHVVVTLDADDANQFASEPILEGWLN